MQMLHHPVSTSIRFNPFNLHICQILSISIDGFILVSTDCEGKRTRAISLSESASLKHLANLTVDTAHSSTILVILHNGNLIIPKANASGALLQSVEESHHLPRPRSAPHAMLHHPASASIRFNPHNLHICQIFSTFVDGFYLGVNRLRGKAAIGLSESARLKNLANLTVDTAHSSTMPVMLRDGKSTIPKANICGSLLPSGKNHIIFHVYTPHHMQCLVILTASRRFDSHNLQFCQIFSNVLLVRGCSPQP